MKRTKINTIGSVILLFAIGAGCGQNSRTPQSVASVPQITDSGLSQVQIEKIEKIKKDEGLRFSIHDHKIIFEPMGPIPPPAYWQRWLNEIHQAIGNDFTNYTVVYPPPL
jgi:hypothetical protein